MHNYQKKHHTAPRQFPVYISIFWVVQFNVKYQIDHCKTIFDYHKLDLNSKSSMCDLYFTYLLHAIYCYAEYFYDQTHL